MARKKNSLLRTIVPLAAVLLGAGVVAAVAVNSGKQSAPSTPGQNTSERAPADTTPDTAADSAPDGGPGGTPPAQAEPDRTAPAEEQPTPPEQEPPPPEPAESASTPPGTVQTEPAQTTEADPADDPGPASDSAPVPGLRARVFDDIPEPAPIGALEGEGGQILYIEFSRYGAGVRSLRLGTGFYEDVGSDQHVEIQAQRSVERPGMADLTAVPFAALSIRVGAETITLAAPGVWRQIEGLPGAFEAFIEDETGRPVLRLVRRYELQPGTFGLTLSRRVENLSDRDLTIRWHTAGPIDLPEPKTHYGGDKRRIRFGYLLNPQAQAGSMAVTADTELTGRHKVLGDRETDAQGYKLYEPVSTIWPTPRTLDKGRRLVWAAFTSRYFAVALHPIYDPDAVTPGGEEKLFEQVDRIDRLVLNPYIGEPRSAVMIMRVGTEPETVPARGAVESRYGVYTGPLLDEEFKADPLLASLNLEGMIAYNFGGFCGEMCTFGWLTHVLLFVLRAAHSIVGDWAAAIIILVLIVRTALHPITRWSQIRLQRFGKQMQAMAPKQQKVREKYKDDPKRQQQEMAKLWQEEGINPAGALGCLPLFLQSPVWIALYATLYFAAEMRHEPAFWGVFQAISGGEWKFLADLSSPDAALPLPSFMHFTPPLLGGLYGRIESVNLLPILMAVLFYMHQKFLQPPTSAAMTPEQEQQQKIIKILFPIMMPIFMYPAPSGLVVYFITNSALAIIENKHIRSSAEKQGLLDLDKIKEEKAAKRQAKGGGGFMARLQALAEERQQQMQGQQPQGKKRVQNAARPEPKPRNYKKRK